MAKENKDLDKRLKLIEEKLESIDGKLSEKWFLPTFITVLTALLGTVSFLVERNVNKADVSDNKQSEVIGEFIGKSKIGFYTECKKYLTEIDEQFESYCKIGQEPEVADRIDTLLINFRKLVVNQQVIDQPIMESMKQYSEFVSDNALDISSGIIDKPRIASVYTESKALLTDANQKLDKEIKKFLSR